MFYERFIMCATNGRAFLCEEEREIDMYGISSTWFEIDHRLRKAPKPIPNFEAKPLLARLVLPWGTRWESRVLISFFFLLAPAIFFCKNISSKKYIKEEVYTRSSTGINGD